MRRANHIIGRCLCLTGPVEASLGARARYVLSDKSFDPTSPFRFIRSTLPLPHFHLTLWTDFDFDLMRDRSGRVALQNGFETCDQSFTFINASHPEETKQKTTQHAIRRHVMTRVADSRRKRPRTWTLTLRIPQVNSYEKNGTVPNGPDPCAHQQHKAPLPRLVYQSPHSYGLFPVDTDSRARQLIHFSTITEAHLSLFVLLIAI